MSEVPSPIRIPEIKDHDHEKSPLSLITLALHVGLVPVRGRRHSSLRPEIRIQHLFQPYEVYAFTTPSNSFIFDDNQMGIEASGHFTNGFKYALGMVNGNGVNPDNNSAKDFYLNTSYTIGKGDGQTTGQRLGAFGYCGWQPTDLTKAVPAPTGETNGDKNELFYRVGVDGSFNYESFNLGVLFMLGHDNKKLNNIDPGSNYKYTGGFAELNWTGLMNDRLVLSFLYNWVRPPSYDAERNVNAYTALLRYYLGDWSAVNVALHAEYTFRSTGDQKKFNEHLVAFVVDFGF